jgi:hypothetical protein
MKMDKKIENLLKNFYAMHRRALKPDDNLDRRVQDSLDSLTSPHQAERPIRYLWQKRMAGLSAAVLIAALGLVVLTRSPHKPDAVPPAKTPPVAAAPSQPTMLSLTMTLRVKGIDAAMRELDRYIPKSLDQFPPLRPYDINLAFNGDHKTKSQTHN